MNSWQIVWTAFYSGSTRRKVAAEMWKLAKPVQRWSIALSVGLMLGGLLLYVLRGQSGYALFATIVGEIVFLLVVDKVKDATFFSEYGRPDGVMTPPDNEEHRVSRYMLFTKQLRQNNITKSHVEDAFPLVDAKLDLESSRGEMPKKYFGFATGLLVGALVSWSRNLSGQELAIAVAGLVVSSFFVLMILGVVPSRTERLKELKYFMSLYCREI